MAKNDLRLMSYTKKYTISSKADISTTIKKLFSDNYFYFPKANNDLSKIEILNLKEVKNMAGKNNFDTLKNNLTNYLNQRMSTGNTVYQLKWKIQDKTFSTLAIMDSGSFIYDHVIANLIRLESKSTKNVKHQQEVIRKKQYP